MVRNAFANIRRKREAGFAAFFRKLLFSARENTAKHAFRKNREGMLGSRFKTLICQAHHGVATDSPPSFDPRAPQTPYTLGPVAG